MSEILFDFYELLVENIFGSVGLAIMGVAFAMFVILLICRPSRVFLIFWFTFYFLIMGTLYLGALGLVIGFMVAVMYTIHSIIRFIYPND